MTDKELIQAFRRCNSHEVCPECPFDGKTECPIAEFTAEKLVDRLEALLAENESQWVSVSERLPEPGERVLATAKCYCRDCVYYGKNGWKNSSMCWCFERCVADDCFCWEAEPIKHERPDDDGGQAPQREDV